MLNIYFFVIARKRKEFYSGTFNLKSLKSIQITYPVCEQPFLGQNKKYRPCLIDDRKKGMKVSFDSVSYTHLLLLIIDLKDLDVCVGRK